MEVSGNGVMNLSRLERATQWVSVYSKFSAESSLRSLLSSWLSIASITHPEHPKKFLWDAIKNLKWAEDCKIINIKILLQRCYATRSLPGFYALRLCTRILRTRSNEQLPNVYDYILQHIIIVMLCIIMQSVSYLLRVQILGNGFPIICSVIICSMVFRPARYFYRGKAYTCRVALRQCCLIQGRN